MRRRRRNGSCFERSACDCPPCRRAIRFQRKVLFAQFHHRRFPVARSAADQRPPRLAAAAGENGAVTECQRPNGRADPERIFAIAEARRAVHKRPRDVRVSQPICGNRTVWSTAVNIVTHHRTGDFAPRESHGATNRRIRWRSPKPGPYRRPGFVCHRGRQTKALVWRREISARRH